MSTRPEDLNYGEDTLRWVGVTDGTITRVELHDSTEEGAEIVGEGIARRAKGDRRNDELGVALATARAYEAASEYYYAEAEKLGYKESALEFTPEEVAAIKRSAAALLRVEAIHANVKSGVT